MRLFAVVLAFAVAVSTQAMAFEPLHHRHSPARIVYLSVALALIAVVVRYLAYTGKELPRFPTGGFLLLLAAYLLLLWSL